jgi:hypothetical protein
MNAKASVIFACAVSGLLCANLVRADSIVVKGGIVYSSSAGALNIALAPGANLPSTCPAGTTLPAIINVVNATATSDVVIVGTNALVKTGNTVTTVPITPACLGDTTPSVSECVARIDSATGNMIVPCIEHQGTIYDAVFEQRGNSMNWELKSALPNVRVQPHLGGSQ